MCNQAVESREKINACMQKKKKCKYTCKTCGRELETRKRCRNGASCSPGARQIAAMVTQRGGQAALMDGLWEEPTGLWLPRSCLEPPPVSAACQRRQRASERRRRGRFLLGINEARLTADLSALAHPRQTVTAEKNKKKNTTHRCHNAGEGGKEKKKTNAGMSRSTDARIELSGTQLFVEETSCFFLLLLCRRHCCCCEINESSHCISGSRFCAAAIMLFFFLI